MRVRHAFLGDPFFFLSFVRVSCAFSGVLIRRMVVLFGCGAGVLVRFGLPPAV